MLLIGDDFLFSCIIYVLNNAVLLLKFVHLTVYKLYIIIWVTLAQFPLGSEFVSGL